MTTAKKPFTSRPMPHLVEQDDGTLLAVWPLSTVRFMFNDGSTVDVVTSRDDSDLRGVLLTHCKADGIAGTARVPSTGHARGDSPTNESAAQAAAGVASPPTSRRRAARPVERPVDPPDSPEQGATAHDE